MNQKIQAFTLIELIIVIVLLGILAATALPRFVNFTEQATTSERDALIGSIKTSLMLVNMARRTTTMVADSPGTRFPSDHPDFPSLYINASGFPDVKSWSGDYTTAAEQAKDFVNLAFGLTRENEHTHTTAITGSSAFCSNPSNLITLQTDTVSWQSSQVRLRQKGMVLCDASAYCEVRYRPSTGAVTIGNNTGTCR